MFFLIFILLQSQNAIQNRTAEKKSTFYLSFIYYTQNMMCAVWHTMSSCIIVIVQKPISFKEIFDQKLRKLFRFSQNILQELFGE